VLASSDFAKAIGKISAISLATRQLKWPFHSSMFIRQKGAQFWQTLWNNSWPIVVFVVAEEFSFALTIVSPSLWDYWRAADWSPLVPIGFAEREQQEGPFGAARGAT